MGSCHVIQIVWHTTIFFKSRRVYIIHPIRKREYNFNDETNKLTFYAISVGCRKYSRLEFKIAWCYILQWAAMRNFYHSFHSVKGCLINRMLNICHLKQHLISVRIRGFVNFNENWLEFPAKCYHFKNIPLSINVRKTNRDGI